MGTLVAEMLVRVGATEWQSLGVEGYTNEAHLQQLLAEHPALVPGVGPDAVVCREFASGVGPADVVVVDRDGNLTLVECKLASNRQVRREVIGQVLDYASRLWRMPVESFEAAWVARVGSSPFEALGDDDGELRRQVGVNLAEARFRIVLAVDAINDDLRRIVEYLNAVTVPATGVVAVEYVRHLHGQVEVLAPRSYGEELAAVKAKQDIGGRSGPRWSVEDFVTWTRDNDPAAVPALTACLDEMNASGFRLNGGRAVTPSINTSVQVPGLGAKWPLLMYTKEDRGAELEVRFGDFRTAPQLADRLAVAATASTALGLSLDEVREADYRKRFRVALREFTPDQVAALVRAIAGALLTTAPAHAQDRR